MNTLLQPRLPDVRVNTGKGGNQSSPFRGGSNGGRSQSSNWNPGGSQPAHLSQSRQRPNSGGPQRRTRARLADQSPRTGRFRLRLRMRKRQNRLACDSAQVLIASSSIAARSKSTARHAVTARIMPMGTVGARDISQVPLWTMGPWVTIIPRKTIPFRRRALPCLQPKRSCRKQWCAPKAAATFRQHCR